MSYGAKGTDFHTAEERDLQRRLAAQKAREERKMRDELSKSGVTKGAGVSAGMRRISRDVDELRHEGMQAIAARKFAASEAEKVRTHATGERIGSQEFAASESEKGRAHATGERLGSEAATSALSRQESRQRIGEMGAGFTFQQKLQKQAEDAKMELQQLVDDNKLTQDEANRAWQGVQNDLNRQLEEWTTSGQWEHDKAMQDSELAHDEWVKTGQWTHEEDLKKMDTALSQWTSMFDRETSQQLQDDTQAFDQFMEELGREWELADRDWHERMWLLDAQLQLACSNYDWMHDDVGGGPPSWIVGHSDDPYDTSYI